MTFQFNFFSSNKKEDEESKVNEEVNDDNLNNFNCCEEWKVPENFLKKEFESETVEGFSKSLLKRKYSNILSELEGKELGNITESSDLIPKQYEGGLKTWECSIDLLNYLMEQDFYNSEISNVLEVGCGSALPGIFCHKILPNPNIFVFQDFNQNVLESVTLPNVILNLKPNSLKNFKFFYGDWKNFPEKLSKNSFDLILTSETIYRSESYHLLLNIFSHALSHKKESRILLAAKDYYFGLGGSVQQFIKFSTSKGWNVRVLRQFTEGVPRSILELTRIQ